MHNGAEILQSDAAATNFIKSVVTFGDPDRKLPVGNVPASKVDIFCGWLSSAVSNLPVLMLSLQAMQEIISAPTVSIRQMLIQT